MVNLDPNDPVSVGGAGEDLRRCSRIYGAEYFRNAEYNGFGNKQYNESCQFVNSRIYSTRAFANWEKLRQIVIAYIRKLLYEYIRNRNKYPIVTVYP